MKFTIERNKLLEILKNAKLPFEKIGTITDQGFVLEVDAGGRLVISTANTEYIRLFFFAELSGECVPGKVFLRLAPVTEFIKSLSSGNIEISLSSGSKRQKVDISQEKVKGSFTLYPKWEAYQYEIPTEYTKNSCYIEGLGDLLKLTYNTISTDITRPVLTGLHIISRDGSTYFESSDGFSLTRIKTNKFNIAEINVPRNTCAILQRFSNDKIYISGDCGLTAFNEDCSWILQSALIDGNFPITDQIVNPQFVEIENFIVRMKSQDFLQAIKSCGVFVKNESNMIIFTLNKDKSLILSATDSERGDQTIEISCEIEGSKDEDNFKICLNYQFLIAVAGLFKKDQIVELHLPVISNAKVLQSAAITSPDIPGFLYILMAMRLSR